MQMRLVTLVSALLVAVGLAAALPLRTAASTCCTDQVTGAEVYAKSTTGYFVGPASGQLPGSFYTQVNHDPLPTVVGQSAAISPGGSFDLDTTLQGTSALVTGTYSGGTITLTSAGSGCTNQVYTVAGSLGSVGPVGGNQTGTGAFNGTLTHYRTLLFGGCVTYRATVTGTVTLTLNA